MRLLHLKASLSVILPLAHRVVTVPIPVSVASVPDWDNVSPSDEDFVPIMKRQETAATHAGIVPIRRSAEVVEGIVPIKREDDGIVPV